MTYSVVAIPNGKWRQNCYIILDDETGTSVLIDPGSDSSLIRQKLALHQATPVAILNTHGHYDHIGAVSELMAHYDIPFYLNPADNKLVKQANLYKFLFDSSELITIPEPTHALIQKNSPLQFGALEISVIQTPGHTLGSVCLLLGSNLFSGDTLLPSGPGRYDLPGGNRSALEESIELLRKFPDEINVWPGHGKPFQLHTIWEKIKKAGV